MSQGHTGSVTQNHKAQLVNAYNELGKELSSNKIRVVGNYTLGKVIGEGAYGKVRLGTHRLTSTRVAIKQVPKAMSSSLTREIHHHRQLHHPHVAQMYEVIATESFIWIVTELCCGGELFDYLAEKGRLGEDEVKILFGQLCLAVAYLHDRGIVHRDLKLENVLMDERCRIKLGDFGFTREFEKGALMETFCGTTGYASPEMLQGKKYLGPEVDVWSLGVILYTLLTGTLPFDDDDDSIMREKIIKEEFEDPVWLSSESRNLIKNILQKDSSNRLTIPQILSHAWFNPRPNSSDRPSSSYIKFPRSLVGTQTPSPPSSPHRFSDSSEPLTTEPDTSPPTTPDDIPAHGDTDIKQANDPLILYHQNSSEHTIKDPSAFTPYDHQGLPRVSEEQDDSSALQHPDPDCSPSSPKVPPHPTRTPARTKRRSVSSTLGDADYEVDLNSPFDSKSPSHLPQQDFSSLLNTPSPIIFSTPLERELLNHLSMLGFDTGQIVHSVLCDACDAAGAVWWMLRRKAEKRAVEAGEVSTSEMVDAEMRRVVEAERGMHGRKTIAVQTESREHGHSLSIARSAPQLAFVPPTPTAQRPVTPPPHRERRLLSPSPTSAERSLPSTPSGSLKDKDKESQGSKGRKGRAGSVSIMQRATTALEAAGLVRKKSAEGVRLSDEINARQEREREKSKENERQSRTFSANDEPRSSYGSGSSKLTKSPRLKAIATGTPTTPSVDSGESHHIQPSTGSPWVLTGSGASPPRRGAQLATPSGSPDDTLTSLPSFPANTGKSPATGTHRSRASLLSTFRLWFHEDRKGKRKETTPPVSHPFPPSSASGTGTVKRRTSGKGTGRFASRKKQNRSHRLSVSSRRSSSVNSRRSSGTSAQILTLDSPHGIVSNRRSFSSHTPNSERDHSSRPSSIRSFQRHRKSPSASSVGSAQNRTSSPVQKYHRRGSSGTSTRVVRQAAPNQGSSTRPAHVRTNSATSSIHSLASSRPASWYDPSETEMQRTSSPFKTQSRRSLDDSTPRKSGYGNSNTTFVAQKKQTPFMSPSGYTYNGSVGRSSWKKSWGLEPPGWRSRTTHLPIEVLSISPAEGSGGIRDVFSGKNNLNLGMGDESDWVDEDDDTPAFAGGLGQTPASPTCAGFIVPEVSQVTLSPAPRGSNGARNAKRGRTMGPASVSSIPYSTHNRQKAGHSPVERTSPLPGDGGMKLEVPETRGGRRQLPPARSGPAFRGHAIQEEDEGEEE